MHIFWGLIGIILSFVLVKYRRYIIDFTGPWGWAERIFGGGGSPLALVLFSVVVFFISLSVMTGSIDGVIQGTFGKLF